MIGVNGRCSVRPIRLSGIRASCVRSVSGVRLPGGRPHAVFQFPQAQSHLPPSLPQGSHLRQPVSCHLLPQNGQACNRIGLTVNAKLGCAVRRNRVRRRLREIYRLHETQFLPGYDIVVVVRGRAMDAPYRELEQAYLSLAEKLSLLRHEDTQ